MTSHKINACVELFTVSDFTCFVALAVSTCLGAPDSRDIDTGVMQLCRDTGVCDASASDSQLQSDVIDSLTLTTAVSMHCGPVMHLSFHIASLHCY